MPITRTPIFDDSGQGTDGTVIDNAWKQEFYDQIDGVIGGVTPFYGHADISDISGAGLGILGTARYAVVGSIVLLQVQAAYPPTSNGLAAKIGPLPYPNNSFRPAGFYVVYGPSNIWHVSLASTEILPLTPGTMAARTNAEMSGSNNALVGFYITV